MILMKLNAIVTVMMNAMMNAMVDVKTMRMGAVAIIVSSKLAQVLSVVEL